jgi:hypothetical protein
MAILFLKTYQYLTFKNHVLFLHSLGQQATFTVSYLPIGLPNPTHALDRL